jgi:hypothetical protein
MPDQYFFTWNMDKKTVFIKTPKGESEGANLSSDLKRILSLIDSKSTVDELAKRAPPSLREGCRSILGELAESGYIRDKNKQQIEPKITSPKFNPLKMFTPKPAEDLDFHTPSAVPAPDVVKLAELATKQKAEEAAQLEAAVAAAKARANSEAAAKADALAKQEAEILARGRALAEADAAAKAEAKAKKEAEIEERARAVAEENAKREAEQRAQAAAKAKQEAAVRMQAQEEAARNKAALEAALRVRAEIEAAAKAQQVAEAKAKQEAAARMKAQEEAARVKAALEIAAREKAEAEEKAKRDAETTRLKVEKEAARVKSELEAASKAKREAEAALLKAEQEAARIRAEMAAAKTRAEADAKALVEARAREEAEAKALAAARAKQEAEEKARRDDETARLKAEHEVALLRAEQDAIAKVRAEAEARTKRDAEEQARREAEAARLKAEYEAALGKAERDAVARVRAEAEAKLRTEADAQAIAEALAKQLHEETVAKLQAAALAERAAEIVEQSAQFSPSTDSTPAPVAAPAYEIQLDGFLGTVEPVAQTFAPVVRQETQDSADTYREDIAKADSASNSLSNVAAEMARLKEESEAVRRKLEAEERRKSEEQALAEEQAKAWAEAEQRAKVQTLIDAEQMAQQAVMSQAKAMQKPVIRSHRKPMPWGMISLVLVVLALGAVLVLPYVYPLDEYIAPLEQRLTAQLKQPVHIGGISASSLPPRLQLKSVTLGSAQEVKIGNIVLNFDVISLFSETKVIGDAELQDVSILGSLLDKQAASLKLIGSNAQFPVRHLSVQRLKIVTDELVLPLFSGIADVDTQGAFSRVALHSIDDKLGIDLQANTGHWQLGVSVKESSLFFLPGVVFSDLSAKGDLLDGEVNFTELDAHIYNGILRGSAKLNWRKGWQLQGQFEAKTFELNKMFPKYAIEGDMYGEGTFSFAGAKLSLLDDAPHLDGSFSVKNGTIIGIDMVETARLQSREHMVGGRTHFDDLIGLVQYDNGVTRFRQVKIASSTMSAGGQFDVSSNNQLGGNFNAEIKMRSGNNALTLFGTITEPKLRATN